MATAEVMTMRRAHSSPYNLRKSLCRTEKAQDLAPQTGTECVRTPEVGTKRKRESHASDASDNDDGGLVKAQKRVRRAHHRGDIVLPSPNRRLLSLPTPDRPPIRHDFTAGGLPPDELIGPDLRFLFPEYYNTPPVTEWAFDPEIGLMMEHIKMLPLPENGSFGDVDYQEEIQGWSLLFKRYCGRSVSPVHMPEPQEMTYKEWEEFARPVGLLLEAVEGKDVYDAVTGK